MEGDSLIWLRTVNTVVQVLWKHLADLPCKSIFLVGEVSFDGVKHHKIVMNARTMQTDELMNTEYLSGHGFNGCPVVQVK